MPFDGSESHPVDPTLLAQVLDRAADLIERGWCDRNYARNWLGFECSPHSPWARKFCARGALQRALWELALRENDAWLCGVNFAALEVAAVREIALAADGEPEGERFVMTLAYEAGFCDRYPGPVPVELAAIERWNDSSKDGGHEVAMLLRLTAAMQHA